MLKIWILVVITIVVFAALWHLASKDDEFPKDDDFNGFGL